MAIWVLPFIGRAAITRRVFRRFTPQENAFYSYQLRASARNKRAAATGSGNRPNSEERLAHFVGPSAAARLTQAEKLISGKIGGGVVQREVFKRSPIGVAILRARARKMTVINALNPTQGGGAKLIERATTPALLIRAKQLKGFQASIARNSLRLKKLLTPTVTRSLSAQKTQAQAERSQCKLRPILRPKGGGGGGGEGGSSRRVRFIPWCSGSSGGSGGSSP